MRRHAAVVFSLVLLVAPPIASAQDRTDVLIDLERESSAARQSDVAGLTPLQRGTLSTSKLEQLSVVEKCLGTACGEVGLSVPFTYNSNPTGAAHQTEDGHTKTDLTLSGSLKFENVPVVAVAAAQASTDGYIVNSSANTDLLKFWVGAALAPEGPLGFYAGYRPTLSFSENFAARTKTLHDLIAGGSLTYSISSSLNLVFDLSAGYRRAEPSASSALLSTLVSAFTYADKPDPSRFARWSVSLKPTVSLTGYEHEVSGKTRRDVRAAATLTAKWNLVVGQRQ